MEAEREKTLTAPTTYEDWLKCFDALKSGSFVDSSMVTAIVRGSFVNEGYIAIRFNEKLADTVNEMLNKRIARFLKDLNMLISFNELADIVPLFVRLRNEVRKCLFFTDIPFLDPNVRDELEKSVKVQMGKFWNETVMFLQKQTFAYCNADLEDSLFLICRMSLFAQAV